MDRNLKLWIGTAALAAMVGTAGAQSLGDAARKNREAKRPGATKVFDNDTLPTTGEITVGQAAPESAKPAAPAAAEDASAPAEKAAAPAGAEDRKKLEAEWRQKFSETRKQIADLERELGLLEREQRLRAAVFANDAARRLQNDRDWSDSLRKYEADRDDRQNKLSAARQRLADLAEELRKAGLPSSWAE